MPTIKPAGAVVLYKDVPAIYGRIMINFASEAQRETVLAQYKFKEFDDVSYVRETGQLKLELGIADAKQINYMSFKNNPFSSKIYYAFVLSTEYISNTVALITYEIDWWTTDMFSIQFRPCVVEREHITAAERQNEVSNPYRADIPELLTPEPLAFSEDYLQLDYGQSNIHPVPDIDVVNELYYCRILAGVSYDALIDSTDHTADWIAFTNLFDIIVDPVASSGEPNLLYMGMHMNLTGGEETAQDFFRKKKKVDDYITLHDLISSDLGGYVLPYWSLIQCRIDPTIPGFYKWDGDDFGQSVYLVPGGRDGETLTLPANNPTSTPLGETLNPIIDIPVNTTYHNPKLNRFPYAYCEIQAPDGNVKEYQYERFTNVSQAGNAQIQFTMLATLGGVPTMCIAPNHYDYYSITNAAYFSYRKNLNMRERLDWGAVPQIGSTNDAWLSWLSGKYATALETRTWEYRYAINDTLENMDYSTVGTIGNWLNGVIPALAGTGPGNNPVDLTVGTAWELTGQKMRRDQVMRRHNQYEGIAQAVNQGMDNMPFTGYQYTKPSHAASQYNAPPQTGIMLFPATDYRFTIRNRVLNPAIGKEYDKWLDMYGYASGRTKVPNVVLYSQGSPLAKPVFAEVGGQMLTYVKTKNCAVLSNDVESARWIENLFDGGIHFIDGATLEVNIDESKMG